MHRIVIVCALALILAPAVVQANAIGLSFSTEFIEDAGLVAEVEVFELYVYVQTDLSAIYGYGASFTWESATLLLVDAVWPMASVNVGDGDDNHLVGFAEPFPVDDWAVVCTLVYLNVAELGPSAISVRPADPPEIDPPSPMIIDPDDPGLFHACVGVPAFINFAVAQEAHSLSDIKALFQ